MKKTFVMILMGSMLLTFATCGGKENASGSGSSGFTGKKYVYDGQWYDIKTSDLPKNYTCVPHEKCVAGFKSLCDGTITWSSTYADVAKAFGDDGIHLTEINEPGYAYYDWFSDEDFADENKVHVLITFKADGDKLTYYSYSSVGINSEDVQ